MGHQAGAQGEEAVKRQTLQERVIDFLTRQYGVTEVAGRSRKYRQFKGKDTMYFIGRNGGVRTGRTVSDSVSITDMVHRMMRV